MSTIKNMGLVEFGAFEQSSPLNHFSHTSGYCLKKVLVKDAVSAGIVQAQYPEAEIVQDKDAILHDRSIDLVIVSSAKGNEINLVGEILQTGKQVRVL